MENTTKNYNLVQPTQDEFYNIDVQNSNMDIIDKALKEYDTQLSDLVYQTAGGTATAITLTMQSLVNGYAKTFIASASNNGAATTINGKSLYKPNTTTAPNLIAGKAYTIWYNSSKDCFFIKASAEGNTIAAHVLAGDTFSNDSDTGLIGTMPNNGSVSQLLNINGSYTIPKGYHDGTGTVKQSIATRSASTIYPSTGNQVISAGQYLAGDQVIAAVGGSASAAQVLNGYSFSSAYGINLTGTLNVCFTKYMSGAQSVNDRAGDSTVIYLPWQPLLVIGVMWKSGDGSHDSPNPCVCFIRPTDPNYTTFPYNGSYTFNTADIASYGRISGIGTNCFTYYEKSNAASAILTWEAWG